MGTRSRAAALAALLLAAGCALRPPPGGFTFAVVGDTPYNAREEVAWRAMIDEINAEHVDLVVHVGDFKGAGEPCTDALYAGRKAEFERFDAPFILTPGDNDWTDCRRRAAGAMDPLERLARLREVFFADRRSLGRRRIALDVQDRCIAPVIPACGCAAHPENRQ